MTKAYPAMITMSREADDPAPATSAEGDGASESQLKVGAQLNQIYEIRRFIARGGMGEVYEGVNLATSERVAIKVILRHLADDPAVKTIFLKEAQIHMRLSHPALAQYRLATHEPTLGVFYIVTEFVDGVGLDTLIGRMIPTEPQLRGLIRRLAEGLGAAHDLGAIHRDISPDNILAPRRNLDLAKIIDFGIAKDVRASLVTVVGDTFAGKLGYVAPEQLGDFDRSIGPWTDLYSLGLVMLALATGQPADMGGSLVEAVDRRRAGVDLSALSPSLQPIFAGMLAPDPANRYRCVQDLLDALGPEEEVWVETADQFAESWQASPEPTAPPGAHPEPTVAPPDPPAPIPATPAPPVAQADAPAVAATDDAWADTWNEAGAGEGAEAAAAAQSAFTGESAFAGETAFAEETTTVGEATEPFRWSPFAVQAAVSADELMARFAADAIAAAQAVDPAWVPPPPEDDRPRWRPFSIQPTMWIDGRPEAQIAAEAAAPAPVEEPPEPPVATADPNAEPPIYTLRGLLIRARRAQEEG